MTRVFAWFLKHSPWLLIAAAVGFVLHVITYTIASGHSPFDALKFTAALQMTLESPRSVVYSHSNNFIVVVDQVLAWLVCGFGWLLIPLVVGALVSETFKVRAAEEELRMALVNAGAEAGKKGQVLDDFVNNNLAAIRKLMYVRSNK